MPCIQVTDFGVNAMQSLTRNSTPDATKLFNAADKLEEKRDFRGAFKLYLSAAQSGDTWSQINLGNCYASGKGTKRDLDKAEYWYKKAYRNGNSTGALNLAIDKKKQGNLRSAVNWLKKAVAMNDGSACVQLAKIYSPQARNWPLAESLLRRVLRMDRDHASELDKEQAESLLKEIASRTRSD